ncbi:hypothetical protein [Thalassovita mangrovi]|uniref:Uncharacterized protein n=1 Tax=Thalassovita mangrovi TaxID=2692236 RepID=A0A6L8LJ63_9RHOB|nr:hypothetical protein [Thalassovita mangrovi]MYM54510.1 hypothetical protein [Thalassovita mangrovi]
MIDLIVQAKAAIGAVGAAGIAAIWIVKAGLGWVALRWWRGRRQGETE